MQLGVIQADPSTTETPRTITAEIAVLDKKKRMKLSLAFLLTVAVKSRDSNATVV